MIVSSQSAPAHSATFDKHLLKSLVIQTVAYALVLLASLGNLLDSQAPFLIRIFIFCKNSRCFSYILKFQNHGGRHLFFFFNVLGKEDIVSQCEMLNINHVVSRGRSVL